MYLSILKEAFIIWWIRFLISKIKLNIISGESLLFRINFIGISFVESNGFIYRMNKENLLLYKRSEHFFSWILGFIPNLAQ